MFIGLLQDFQKDTIVPLAQFQNRKSLAHSSQLRMISNVCPHQNATLTTETVAQLRCPYHGLKFDCHGQGIDNSYLLDSWPVYRSSTMLFDQPVPQFPIDTNHMVLFEQRIDQVAATIDVIMDVFIDVDHIPIVHSGVYDRVGINNIDQLRWETFNGSSLQYVPAQDNSHMIDQDQTYGLGAVWMAVYPDTMIEWQPGAMFVTVAIGDNTISRVFVYKYKDNRYDQTSWQTNEQVWELAWLQDRQLAESITSLPQDNLDSLKSHHRTWLGYAV